MIQERTAGISPFALRSCALKKHNIYHGLQLLLRFKSAKVTKKHPQRIVAQFARFTLWVDFLYRDLHAVVEGEHDLAVVLYGSAVNCGQPQLVIKGGQHPVEIF